MKSIKMTLWDLMEMEHAIAALQGMRGMPFSIAYEIAKISKKIEEELVYIENVRKHKILEYLEPGQEVLDTGEELDKDGNPKKDKNGKTIMKSGKSQADLFMEDFTEWLKKETTEVKVTALLDARDSRFENAEIAPVYIKKLLPFFKDY
jgi:hypothetical protein